MGARKGGHRMKAKPLLWHRPRKKKGVWGWGIEDRKSEGKEKSYKHEIATAYIKLLLLLLEPSMYWKGMEA